MRNSGSSCVVATLSLAGACAADAAPLSNALHPAGIQAARIADLWHLTLWTCLAVFVAVLVALLLALRRSARAAREGPPQRRPQRTHDPRMQRTVGAAAGISVLLLVALVVVDIATDRSLSRLPVADALHIEMTGHQWWWEARYRDADGSPAFTVASELHVPVGRPVVVALKSADVIHTFWVPNLHGKKDMLPGRASSISFRADQAGTYRGQCAEFCGLEHALMAFSITALPADQYAAWDAQQRRSARAPMEAEAVDGQRIFMSTRCAQCHTIKGSPADGTLGPDLTHLASRRTIAAGSAANDRPTLAAWIVQPQNLKPGTTMPPTRLTPDEVRQLVAYLESLE